MTTLIIPQNSTKFNYATLKQWAADTKKPVSELLVMHPSNDPFYVGSPSDVRDAEWFADLWQRSGMRKEHLRALHYWIVSDKQPTPYKLPRTVGWQDKDTKEQRTSDIYINNEACWILLEKASLKARDLGLVDPDEITDNRSPKPTINTPEWKADAASYETEENSVDIPYFEELPEEFELAPRIDAHIRTFQPYLIEVWIEKSTLDKILTPICARYGVNIIGGKGFSSATAIRDLLQRVKQANRPGRLLYISDFDKNGRAMPFAVARRIEYYQRNDGFGDLDITLQPIVLNAAQVEKYKLPVNPDDGESVELDAMKVNYPEELKEIIVDAILQYHDPDLMDKQIEAENNLDDEISEIRDAVIENNQDAIDRLMIEYRGIAIEINGVISRLQDRFTQVTNSLRDLSDMLQGEIEQSIDINDLQDYVPDPLIRPGVNDPLYSSNRDYMTQLEAYNAHKGGVL